MKNTFFCPFTSCELEMIFEDIKEDPTGIEYCFYSFIDSEQNDIKLNIEIQLFRSLKTISKILETKIIKDNKSPTKEEINQIVEKLSIDETEIKTALEILHKVLNNSNKMNKLLRQAIVEWERVKQYNEDGNKIYYGLLFHWGNLDIKDNEKIVKNDIIKSRENRIKNGENISNDSHIQANSLIFTVQDIATYLK